MAKQINQCIGGVVKKVSKVSLAIGGVVKQAKKGVCGIGGVVKEFFTNSLILWDGSNLQNGCTWQHNRYRFYYTMTAGELIGKKLVVVPKTKLSESYINVHTYKPNGIFVEHYLCSNGTLQSLPKYAASSWTAGTQYTFNFSLMGYYDTTTRIQFGLGNLTGGDSTVTGCISLVEIS